MKKIILVITKIIIALAKHLQQLKNTDLSTYEAHNICFLAGMGNQTLGQHIPIDN
jgi:hypothetical protein